jgi:hypothetical protein
VGASATVKYHYSHGHFTYSIRLCPLFERFIELRSFGAEQCGRHSQVGSLAGAAHLLNDNAGVLG